MKQNIDRNLIINKRKSKAWTQSHLAEITGLSLRTVQRIEKTGKASFESIKSLASVFDTVAQELLIEYSLEEKTVKNKGNSKGRRLANIGLVFSYSLLLAIIYGIIKLFILYFELSSASTFDSKYMSNGISKALTAPIISVILSYFGVVIFGLSKLFYRYNNNTYNKLILLPIVVLVALMPIQGAILLMLYFLFSKYSEKVKIIKS